MLRNTLGAESVGQGLLRLRRLNGCETYLCLGAHVAMCVHYDSCTWHRVGTGPFGAAQQMRAASQFTSNQEVTQIKPICRAEFRENRQSSQHWQENQDPERESPHSCPESSVRVLGEFGPPPRVVRKVLGEVGDVGKHPLQLHKKLQNAGVVHHALQLVKVWSIARNSLRFAHSFRDNTWAAEHAHNPHGTLRATLSENRVCRNLMHARGHRIARCYRVRTAEFASAEGSSADVRPDQYISGTAE